MGALDRQSGVVEQGLGDLAVHRLVLDDGDATVGQVATQSPPARTGRGESHRPDVRPSTVSGKAGCIASTCCEPCQNSRHFGTMPLQDVIGRVRQVWFSCGEGGVRWEHLGRVAQ
ncbi:hypothetical protein [Ideonella sp. A 288]|uniref:hypothetical protein n=1 Tax=Ideonella sp. A 288 TaxID=1962181 RepID=UPI000B4B7CA8|nr:hypothetical protein [Ideonella sp. A 288]